jgi:16S rRNA (cytosine967-C5)-methyltransferase
VHAVAADALRPPFTGPFDVVLLDAPCSGLGTIGPHPDIRWRAQETDLRRHAQRQGEMLGSLSSLLARGGRLVYATCSSETEENEAVVEGFLAAHPRFSLAALPAWASPFAEAASSYARTTPERHGGDAFFAAVLVLD